MNNLWFSMDIQRPVICILCYRIVFLYIVCQVPLQLGQMRKALHLTGILDRISLEFLKWIERSGRQLPPEWTMPDLVRAVISDNRIDTPGFITHYYYDVMLHRENSWLCQEILKFLDLINYVF